MVIKMETNNAFSPENTELIPEKEKKCRSSIAPAAIGASAGLFIPFIGSTFVLAGIFGTIRALINRIVGTINTVSI